MLKSPKMMVFALVLLNLAVSARLFAEDKNQTDLTDKGAVYFSYHFSPGDILRYYVEAQDSIIVDLDPALRKTRKEIVELTCDSIGSNGHIFITQSTIKCVAFESRAEIRNSVRESSPWNGRKVQFEIDSLGNRYNYKIDFPNRYATATGGAFQPILLIPIIEDQKTVGESWLVERTEEQPENGVPPPVLKYSCLYRAMAPVDTLGMICDAFQYVRTGNGFWNIDSKELKIDMTSVLNSGGIFYLSREYKVPLFLFGTAEQKIKMKQNSGKDIPVWQYTNIIYSLGEYIKSGKTVYKSGQLMKAPAEKKKAAKKRRK